MRICGTCQYFVGEFDGKKFTNGNPPETTLTLSNLSIAEANRKIAAAGFGGDVLDLQAEIEVGNAEDVGFKVLQGDGQETLVGFTANPAELYVDRTKSGKIDFHETFAGRHSARLDPVDGRVSLRILAHIVGPGLGTPDANGDRESLLDKILGVTPLRADGLKSLEGKQVCAVVYDSDISINYGLLNGFLVNGSLKGANLGTVAFEVKSVTALAGLEGFSSSSLPKVEIDILDAKDLCEGNLELLTDAPEPISSSEPFDVLP